jgi:hypothetical protein
MHFSGTLRIGSIIYTVSQQQAGQQRVAILTDAKEFTHLYPCIGPTKSGCACSALYSQVAPASGAPSKNKTLYPDGRGGMPLKEGSWLAGHHMTS